MAILHVEKLGGLAGFGGSNAHVRSRGKINTTELHTKDQKAVDSLFQSGNTDGSNKVADGFRFRISRTTDAGTETVEVPEAHVPASVVSCVKDELV